MVHVFIWLQDFTVFMFLSEQLHCSFLLFGLCSIILLIIIILVLNRQSGIGILLMSFGYFCLSTFIGGRISKIFRIVNYDFLVKKKMKYGNQDKSIILFYALTSFSRVFVQFFKARALNFCWLLNVYFDCVSNVEG